jgi:Uma2 family endonuclease
MAVQTLPAQEATQEVQPTRWTFTVADYHRMLEVGIFTEDDRVELIDGEVIRMGPIGSPHAATVNRLNAILAPQIGNTAIVSIQNPVVLTDSTEPQPDLLILKYRDDFYENALPGSADVLLIIEVSDTTLAFDRQEKLSRYAQAGIPEVWITVLENATVERYSEPSGNQYSTKQTYKRGQSVNILALPQIIVSVDSIFGKKVTK